MLVVHIVQETPDISNTIAAYIVGILLVSCNALLGLHGAVEKSLNMLQSLEQYMLLESLSRLRHNHTSAAYCRSPL